MNSFYGGKQGKSFIIAQTYSTIEEMVQSFGKNNIDCPVNFDEYALINTVNKNNPENGQIFRRGYDYNSDRKIISYRPVEGQPNPYEEFETEANGAVYIGTIVGPAGRAPIFNFGNYSTVQNICQIREKTFEDLGITYKKDLKYSEVVAVLNSKTQTHTDENGNIVIDEETGKPIIVFNLEETIDDFYTLKLTTPTNPNVVQYYCYDFRYGLNNQHSVGWYFIESVPTTGEDKFKPQEYNLIPGVTYDYDENGNLKYDVDENGKRHMKKGTNPVCPLNENNENNPYQDTIDWTYCTVRNENLEDSTAYVGFRFASPVIEFETESVDAYYNRSDMIGNPIAGTLPRITNNFENLNLITRDQSQEEIEQHPFYSKWKINIPKGLKGESIHNLRVTTAAEEQVYAFKLDNNGNFVYNKYGEIQVEDYEGKDDDLTRPRQIIVFDYVSYDRIKDGETYTIYLGDFNQISSVEFKHNGQLIFDYTHDNIQPIPQKDWIHWIDAMHFNEDGTVTITFNDKDWNVDQSENQDKIENGILKREKLINWINNISLNTGDGEIYIEFNNNSITGEKIKTKNIGTEEEPKEVSYYQDYLTWVKDITFDDFGTVITDYTTEYEGEGKNDEGNRVQQHLIKWINKVLLNTENGEIYIEFNNNSITGENIKTKTIETENGSKEVSYYQNYLQWIKNIEVKNDGTVKYDGTQQDDSQNKIIKWINEFSLDETDGHLLIKFNNDQLNTGQVEPLDDENQISVINKNLTWLKYFDVDEQGNVTYTYTHDTDTSISRTDNNVIKWIENISLDEKTGHFIVNFNYNKDPKTNETTQINQFLTWIKDIKLDNDGTVHWEYTTSEDNHEEKNYIKWINDIIINDDGAGNGNQKVSVRYNTSNDYIDVGSPLNYVMRMAVNPVNGDLLALYSDPQKRQTGYTYDNVTGWTILGNIKYSTTMAKEDYEKTSASERVSNLMTGSICYCVEEIE